MLWPPFFLCLVLLVCRLVLALAACGCWVPVSWPRCVAWCWACPWRAVPLAAIPGAVRGPRAVARTMAAVVALSMSRTMQDLRCARMMGLPVRLWCTREIPGAMGRRYGED